MHKIAFISLLAAAAGAFSPSAMAQAPSALPHWLGGHWCSETADQTIEEHWLGAAGGMMLGVSRTLTQGRKAQFEFMRIEQVDGLPTFIAQPQGVPGTAFKQSATGAEWVKFENAAHDFPNQIEYRRTGDELNAAISGPGDDGKDMTIPFAFKRCKG